jgi:hypothetical protein
MIDAFISIDDRRYPDGIPPDIPRLLCYLVCRPMYKVYLELKLDLVSSVSQPFSISINPESQEKMSISMSLIKREDKASDHLGVIIGTSPFSLLPAMECALMNRFMCWSSCYYRSYRTPYRFCKEEESEKALDWNREDMNITKTSTFPTIYPTKTDLPGQNDTFLRRLPS